MTDGRGSGEKHSNQSEGGGLGDPGSGGLGDPGRGVERRTRLSFLAKITHNLITCDQIGDDADADTDAFIGLCSIKCVMTEMREDLK